MPIITISRGTLSGGQLFAQKLGERLGIKVISREVIVEAAKEAGITEKKLKEGLESPKKVWDWFSHQKEKFILAIQSTLAEMVKDGDAIYHGYAGAFLLKGLPMVVKLRLVATMDYRIRAAMMEYSESREDAIRRITAADDLRTKWVRQLYHEEWADPSLYDMVINLGHISIESAVDLVANFVSRDEYRSTPESKQKLEDFALTVNVSAALAFNSNISLRAWEIKVHKGVAQIKRGAETSGDKGKILKIVKDVEGIKEVVFDGEAMMDEISVLSSTEKKASDVMLPISSYPHVHQWITLKEAFVALGASSVRLRDGHIIHPRYVLVLDEMGRLVGVICRRDLLRGLTPQLQVLERAKGAIESVAPFVDMSYSMANRWISLFSSEAIANSKEPVKTVMKPVRGMVKVDDSLNDVVSTMVMQNIDLLPVLDGEKVVGVVLMTEVFDTVAQFIAEEGAGKT